SFIAVALSMIMISVVVSSCGPDDKPNIGPYDDLVTNITLKKHSLNLGIGSKFQLEYDVESNTSLPRLFEALEWSSTDIAVATVNSIGVVTAISEGVCEIAVKVSPDGVSDICEVTVSKESLYIFGSLGDSTYILKDLDTLYNLGGLLPIDMDVYKSDVYYTTNLEIVEIIPITDENGNVTGSRTERSYENLVYKNGQLLPGYKGKQIQVVDGNVYTLFESVVYKNGERFFSPTSGDEKCESEAMFVTDTHVYLCGRLNDCGPRIWKINSSTGILENTTYMCNDWMVTYYVAPTDPVTYISPVDSLKIFVGDIYVEGSDVYVCGDRFNKKLLSRTGRFGYVWKNGDEIAAEEYYIWLDMVVNNGKVYTVGYSNPMYSFPAVYLNGPHHSFTSSEAQTGRMLTICKHGDDVYYSGYIYAPTINIWKNDELLYNIPSILPYSTYEITKILYK
ncbi:MAG: hypothetical protein J6X92_00770, partial [Bacteroidales bacterium]|nr:hypothetical protein [Bacteroidales bacterium]